MVQITSHDALFGTRCCLISPTLPPVVMPAIPGRPPSSSRMVPRSLRLLLLRGGRPAPPRPEPGPRIAFLLLQAQQAGRQGLGMRVSKP